MSLYLRLKRKQTARKIIEGIVTLLSIAGIFLFASLREKSKAVKVVETPLFSYETVSYEQDYVWPIIIFVLLLIISVSVLLTELIMSRVYHVEIDGEDVIIYNGFFFYKLLVNGEERDFTVGKCYLETTLSSGVKITASLQAFYSFHLTFSDNRPAIDL